MCSKFAAPRHRELLQLIKYIEERLVPVLERKFVPADAKTTPGARIPKRCPNLLRQMRRTGGELFVLRLRRQTAMKFGVFDDLA
jgi:hypothetical protein